MTPFYILAFTLGFLIGFGMASLMAWRVIIGWRAVARDWRAFAESMMPEQGKDK